MATSEIATSAPGSGRRSGGSQPAGMRESKTERPVDTADYAGVGIAEVDARGRLLRANAGLAELMGCAPEDLLGRSIFDEADAEDADAERSQFRRQVAGEIDRYGIEKRIHRHDRSSVWCQIQSTSVHGANGCFRFAVRVYHDISDRKRAEEQLARRQEEQAALCEFTYRLQKARALGDIYEPALDAIVKALRCQRAAVLLFDKGDRMRFVAWRGLSEAYRGAVDGHSPWPADAEDPAPICIADIADAELDAGLAAKVKAEGIGAIAFIPVLESGRLLGKFMAYYDRPHAFGADEVSLARTIAGQLGFSIERIHAQKAAQHLSAIVESSEDAIVSKDLNGVISTWNRGAERLFGYAADEVIGKPVTILIPRDRLDEEPAILERIRRGERIDHFETVRRRKDGSDVAISLTVSPVRDHTGAIVGASKIARDITLQKRAEAMIHDSEQQLQGLLAAIPAAIYTTDAMGVVTYFNEAAVELAGRIPEVGRDRWCVTWKLYRPDGTPMSHDECPMATAMKEGRAIRNVEAVAERPDGTRVPFIPFATPLRDADGRIVGGINMLVDISERKQAETQQRTLLNELNHRVKNNMQMLQALLQTSSARSDSPEAKRVLAEASARVSAMAAAQRILYDATTRGTAFSARGFLQAVCDSARQSLRANIEDEVGEDAEIPNDAAMPLALILNELLTNAVKHAPAAAPIRVGLTHDDQGYELFVEDGGPGFDLGMVRGRSSGLRLVQGLASQLRGRFDVRRTPATRCSLRFA